MKNHKESILFFFLASLFLFSLWTSCRPQNPSAFEYREGDLIFQDLDCELCDAIEKATRGYKNKPVSHMGIITLRNDTVYVWEAYDKVRLTPLDTFLARSPRILVGRLKEPYRVYIPDAIRRAEIKRNLPYDEEFRLNNGKYYCSELVHDVFLDGTGQALFPVYPMNFKNLSDGTFDSVWVEYFEKLGIPIPQGEPGCNPADYSRSDKIRILYETY